MTTSYLEHCLRLIDRQLGPRGLTIVLDAIAEPLSNNYALAQEFGLSLPMIASLRENFVELYGARKQREQANERKVLEYPPLRLLLKRSA